MASVQPMPFSHLLKRYRLNAGLTQEGLAERAQLSVRAISQLERGVRQTPRKDTLALLAEALRLSEDERARFHDAARRSALSTHASGDTLWNGAQRVTQRATTPNDLRLPRWPPMIGRARERLLLERHLSKPSSGPTPPLLLLAGEPGIGKSRLLQEAINSAAAANWTVLFGGCHRKSGQEPYAPLVGALARFLAQRTPAQQRMDLQGCSWLVHLLPELSETTLVPTTSWPGAEAQERRLTFSAVARFLANIAGSAGTLLVLDDVQWAGEDALDLLASLLRVAQDYPVRVLAAYRDHEIQPTDPLGTLLSDLAREELAVEAQLEPLDAAEARKLIGDMLRITNTGEMSADLPDNVREQMVRRAGGIPFFLVSCAELLRAEAQASQPDQPTMEWSSIPRDAQQSIRQRVAMLPEIARELLGIAAVAGRETPRWLLQEVAHGQGKPADTVVEALEVACHARLLAETEDGSYQFTHDLIREVVAADVSGIRRAALHLRLAHALEHSVGEPSAELLAYHYARSDDQQNTKIWLERAGDKAFSAHANADAAEYFRDLVRRLDAATFPVETARANEKLGTALRLLGRSDEAFTSLCHADALYMRLGDVQGRARAMVQVATRGIACSAQERLALLQPVIEQLERTGLTSDLALLYERQATLLRATFRNDEALAAAQHAIDLAKACGDERGLISAQVRFGSVLLCLGRIEEGARVIQEQIGRAEALGDVASTSLALMLGYICIVMVHAHKGAFSTGRAVAQRAVTIAQQEGDLTQEVYTKGTLGWCAFHTGAWDEVQECLEEVIVRCRQAGPAVLSDAGYALGVLGMLYMARGEHAAAVTYLEESIQQSQMYDPNDGWLAQITLAESDLLDGRPQLARDRLQSLLLPQRHHALSAPYFLPLLAWAYLDLGEHAAARQACADAIGRAQSLGCNAMLVEGLRAQALVAMRQSRWSSSRKILDESLALVRAMPYPYMEAKLLYTYGLAEQKAKRPEQARTRLREALAICERLDERLYRAHIEQELATL